MPKSVGQSGSELLSFNRSVAGLQSRIPLLKFPPQGAVQGWECQKVWGSAGFVRIYGHMIHRRPTDTAVAIGCLYRDRREGYRHGGRQAVRKRQQCPPRTVDRAGHPRPRHALPDCPTLFGTLVLRLGNCLRTWGETNDKDQRAQRQSVQASIPPQGRGRRRMHQ